MSESFTHPGLASSRGTLAQQYRLGLLDLDGVVYRGQNPVAYAAEGISASERAGMVMSYTTNNASRWQTTVADQISSFGISVRPDQIITSAMVAASMLSHHLDPGAGVMVVGTEHLREEIAKVGLRVVDSVTDSPDAVVQGWHADLTWEELAQAAYAVEKGAQFFVTNRDLTIPRELGIAPGNGAMINAVIEATGVQPLASAGKPEPGMYNEARTMMAHESEPVVPVSQSLPVGDRLDTDIEAANRGGYDSLVVLTGVATPRKLLLANPLQRPTYIAADLRGLTEEHVAPARIDDVSFRSGEVTARLEELHTIEVSAHTGIDALRAACALAWTLADSGIDLESVDLPAIEVNSAA